MELDKETLECYKLYLEKKKSGGDVHASNILVKINNNNKSKIQNKVILKHLINYIKYRKKLNDSDSLEEKTKIYNNFRFDSFKLNRNDNNKEIFTFQSKFLSTIMEEFFKLILQPLADKYGLSCGSIKAFNQLSIQSINSKTPQFTISEKDQDIALYKEIELKIDSANHKIYVPSLSIECKTWLDKTMLEGAASTANRIKQGVTNAKFYIICDTYGVGKSVVKPKDIDKIFITKQRIHDNEDNKYDASSEVVNLIYSEVEKHLESSIGDPTLLIEKSIKKGYIS